MLQEDPGRFAAILLDWDMPRLTGIELLRCIKNQPEFANVPVIMQTVMDRSEQIREGIDAGAFYYLTKPFDQRLLLSIVRAALSDFHYKAALERRLRESQDPFRILVEGRFRFRTLEEGENLALWIASACPVPEEAMGIIEVMTNAVEHGNLGITYDEKTELVESGRWRGEVERRLALPENAAKYVEVRIEKTPERLTVLVEDRGAGFDYRQYMLFDAPRAFDNHGRGIAMAGRSMGLEYMGKGDRVRVTLPLC